MGKDNSSGRGAFSRTVTPEVRELRTRLAKKEQLCRKLSRHLARLKKKHGLRSSDERHQLTNQATNDIVWDWDLTNGQLEWNPAVEAAVGRPRAQMPDTIESWHEHIHPEDRARVVAGILKAIDDEGKSLER